MTITGKIPRELIGKKFEVEILSFEDALTEIKRTRPRFKIYPPAPNLDIFTKPEFTFKRFTEMLRFPIYVFVDKETPVLKIKKSRQDVKKRKEGEINPDSRI